MVFPMCECGVVPVIRRLIRKGLPVSCALTYLLAAPIVNPIVALSTFAAFRGQHPGNGDVDAVVDGIRRRLCLRIDCAANSIRAPCLIGRCSLHCRNSGVAPHSPRAEPDSRAASAGVSSERNSFFRSFPPKRSFICMMKRTRKRASEAKSYRRDPLCRVRFPRRGILSHHRGSDRERVQHGDPRKFCCPWPAIICSPRPE